MGYDFSKAAGVKVSERGQYLTPGHYVLKIKRNIVKRTRAQKDLWITETTVVESSNPEHKPGSDRNWVQNISDPQIGFRAVKGFLYAAAGLDHRDPEHKRIIDEELEAELEEEIVDAKGAKHKVKQPPKIIGMMTEALEDPSDPACKNSLKDCFVRVEVKTIQTKDKGTDFGLHIFTPYTETAAEETKASA